jgi:hypothetical protein
VLVFTMHTVLIANDSNGRGMEGSLGTMFRNALGFVAC